MTIYTRIKKFRNKDGTAREYLYLSNSTWDKETKKTRQYDLCNLGRVDKPETTNIVENMLKSLAKHTDKLNLIEACKDIDPASSKTFGEIQIFKKLWKELGFETCLNKYFLETEKQINPTDAIFSLVCNRLIAPSSKREASEWKKEVYEPNWDNLELHHFYRSMDFLVENKENLEIEMFENMKNIFNCKVNVVMFDTTSVSYWGEGKDELLAYGHSKNKRFDLKQLVIGIIMDQNGIPLAHEVWEGNKSDKPAFKEVIEKIKKKFCIEKVICVADRGMISEDNLKYLEENNFEYILGVKTRQLNKLRQQELLKDEEFEQIQNTCLKAKETKEYELFEKEIRRRNEKRKNKKSEEEIRKEIETFKNTKKAQRRWITCLNESVAELDKVKREYFHQIIANRVEFNTAKEWIVKNGYKKYVIIDEMKIRLNEEKLREDELYDGKWVLITNSTLPKLQLVTSYKDLARIERHFRDLKSEIEVGPVYHWVERRIRSHVFVCFIALQLKTALEKRLKELDENLSYSEVMRDVRKIKAVEFKVKEQLVIIRTDLGPNAHFAFKAVKTAIPGKVIMHNQN